MLRPVRTDATTIYQQIWASHCARALRGHRLRTISRVMLGARSAWAKMWASRPARVRRARWTPRLLIMIGLVIGLGIAATSQAHADDSTSTERSPAPQSILSLKTGVQAVDGATDVALGTVDKTTKTLDTATRALASSTPKETSTAQAKTTHADRTARPEHSVKAPDATSQRRGDTLTGAAHTAGSDIGRTAATRGPDVTPPTHTVTRHAKAPNPNQARDSADSRATKSAKATKINKGAETTKAPASRPAPKAAKSAARPQPASTSEPDLQEPGRVSTTVVTLSDAAEHPVAAVRSLGVENLLTGVAAAAEQPVVSDLAVSVAGTSTVALDLVQGVVDPSATTVLRPVADHVIDPATSAIVRPLEDRVAQAAESLLPPLPGLTPHNRSPVDSAVVHPITRVSWHSVDPGSALTRAVPTDRLQPVSASASSAATSFLKPTAVPAPASSFGIDHTKVSVPAGPGLVNVGTASSGVSQHGVGITSAGVSSGTATGGTGSGAALATLSEPFAVDLHLARDAALRHSLSPLSRPDRPGCSPD